MSEVLQRAINIARGCHDYGGGHVGEKSEAFHHGIDTVITCLERAAAGDGGLQLQVVESIGRELPAPPEPTGAEMLEAWLKNEGAYGGVYYESETNEYIASLGCYTDHGYITARCTAATLDAAMADAVRKARGK